MDRVTLVMRNEEGFYVKLFVPLFEWFLAEKVVTNEVKLELLDDKRKFELSLGIFPSQ